MFKINWHVACVDRAVSVHWCVCLYAFGHCHIIMSSDGYRGIDAHLIYLWLKSNPYFLFTTVVSEAAPQVTDRHTKKGPFAS